MNSQDSKSILEIFWYTQIYGCNNLILEKYKNLFPYPSLEHFLYGTENLPLEHKTQRGLRQSFRDYVNLKGRYPIQRIFNSHGCLTYEIRGFKIQHLNMIIDWMDRNRILETKKFIEGELAKIENEEKIRRSAARHPKETQAARQMEIAKAIRDADVSLRKKQSSTGSKKSPIARPPRVPLQGDGNDWREQE
jgi:hypothetical protein